MTEEINQMLIIKIKGTEENVSLMIKEIEDSVNKIAPEATIVILRGVADK